MIVIVGLGNPGREYDKTRHNAGFMVVDRLAAEVGISVWKEEHRAKTATFNAAGKKIMLVKPQTFMNLSGEAVGPLLRYYKVKPADMVVIYDDMDLPIGKLRIRTKGSDGGHNGMKSLIAHVGTKDFPRVRVGVGRPSAGWTVVNHVLAKPQAEDAKAFEDGIDAAAAAVRGIWELGLDLAMNRFNPRHKAKEKDE